MNCRPTIVLIVEDEYLIRMNARDMVEESGYAVLEARNADEAITILEARADIAVIFTDVQMPGSMDGLKLAAAVRNRWPPVKIIAASGRTKLTDADLPEGAHHMSKPYTRRQVADHLQDLLG